MKKFIYLIGVLTFMSCSNKSPEIKTIEISEKSIFSISDNLTKLNISIEGMSCEMGCALKIEKKLNAKYGANTIKVDFLKKTGIVQFDNQILDFDKIKNEIENLGPYKANKKL